MRKRKAILLFSGGLDSLIVAKILEEQNIIVKAVNYKTSFFGGDEVKEIGERYGIKVVVEDISVEYIKRVLLNPEYGYGKNMNPCIDCHRYMIKKAKERLDRGEADFIATGEVLGERPFSQNINALSIVEKPARGYVLRPLSALLLKPTIPEMKGWVDRTKLYGLKGRSRKPHLELARKYGIDYIPSPAGGCILTDPGFSYRLKHFLSREKVDINKIELLKIGRHFIPGKGRLVIPRNEKEKKILKSIYEKIRDAIFIRTEEGFVALAYGTEDLKLIARICSPYVRNSEILKITYRGQEELFSVNKEVDKADVRKYMLLKG